MTKVSVISESEFAAKGHGVHTAYLELTGALRDYTDLRISVNKKTDADVMHVHTIGLYSLRHMLMDSHKKVVVSAHVVPDSLVGSLVAARFWLPLAKQYIRWFYNKADLVFAVSDDTKRDLIDLGVNKPIEVVYNIVDTKKYKSNSRLKAAARKKLRIDEDAWIVMGAGQVQPRKRVDQFVDEAKKHPDMQFIWVGGLPFGKLMAESAAMQRMMASPPSNVRFSGIIELEAMIDYYRAADVFWLPSEQETFGLVVVEAAAAGLPVILRDIPDYSETFSDSAVMVVDAAVTETINMLRSDTDFYTRAVENSKKIAHKYDAVAGARRVATMFEQLLKA